MSGGGHPGSVRLAKTPDPPVSTSTDSMCGVFRVTMWLLQLQLADLHSSQRKGRVRVKRGEHLLSVPL